VLLTNTGLKSVYMHLRCRFNGWSALGSACKWSMTTVALGIIHHQQHSESPTQHTSM